MRATRISISNHDYKVFHTSIINIFQSPFGKDYFRRRIRYALQSINKNIVLLLEVDGDIIGYSFLERKSYRYPFAGKKDWFISPYVINEKYRGRGYGTILLQDSIAFFKENCLGSLFALVQNNNKPSLGVFSKFSFPLIGRCKKENGILQKYIIDSQGDYYLFKLN